MRDLDCFSSRKKDFLRLGIVEDLRKTAENGIGFDVAWNGSALYHTTANGLTTVTTGNIGKISRSSIHALLSRLIPASDASGHWPAKALGQKSGKFLSHRDAIEIEKMQRIANN